MQVGAALVGETVGFRVVGDRVVGDNVCGVGEVDGANVGLDDVGIPKFNGNTPHY